MGEDFRQEGRRQLMGAIPSCALPLVVHAKSSAGSKWSPGNQRLVCSASSNHKCNASVFGTGSRESYDFRTSLREQLTKSSATKICVLSTGKEGSLELKYFVREIIQCEVDAESLRPLLPPVYFHNIIYSDFNIRYLQPKFWQDFFL